MLVILILLPACKGGLFHKKMKMRPAQVEAEEVVPEYEEDIYADEEEGWEMEDVVYSGDENGHGWVNLGLGSFTFWADYNIGATSPEEAGDYFAWGETAMKGVYRWDSLKYRIDGDTYDTVTLSKYNTLGSRGTQDGKTVLELSDDAARQRWGGRWVTPTVEDWMELIEYCNWEWTILWGVEGYRVTGINGNSIFLPAVGWRDDSFEDDLEVRHFGEARYWSSSLNQYKPYSAYGPNFSKDEITIDEDARRYRGRSIRPVIHP